MDIVEGVVRCWPLSKTCGVDWEAWTTLIAFAAFGASVLGVFVSGLSAIAVYMLGRETNNLAKVTRDSTLGDRDREANFILLTIHSDVISLLGYIGTMLDKRDSYRDSFCDADPRQSEFFNRLATIDLPIDTALLGRLHVLESNIGLAIVRCRAQLQMARLIFSIVDVYVGNRQEMEAVYKKLLKRLNLAKPQLDIVYQAGDKALQD